MEKSSDSKVLFGVGMTCGIMMYMFIFIYGAQIMQGIIEEKTSKVVEVIVSSVKPFQLMMGKIIGLASVGLVAVSYLDYADHHLIFSRARIFRT